MKKVLSDQEEENTDKKPLGMLKDIDSFMNNIKKIIGPVVIIVLFLILTHNKVNKAVSMNFTPNLVI